jgi:hypothetical protein
MDVVTVSPIVTATSGFPSSPGPALGDPEKAKEIAAVARAIVNTLFFMVKILNCVFKTLPNIH